MAKDPVCGMGSMRKRLLQALSTKAKLITFVPRLASGPSKEIRRSTSAARIFIPADLTRCFERFIFRIVRYTKYIHLLYGEAKRKRKAQVAGSIHPLINQALLSLSFPEWDGCRAQQQRTLCL